MEEIKPIKITTCGVCGAEIRIHKKQALKKKYCSDKCKKIYIRKWNNEQNRRIAEDLKKYAPKEFVPTNNPQLMTERVNEGLKKGLTYGMVQANATAQSVTIKFPSFVKKTIGRVENEENKDNQKACSC